jgi:hypothetical protein
MDRFVVNVVHHVIEQHQLYTHHQVTLAKEVAKAYC